MKAFSALALAAAPQMLNAGLKRPIILALSYDEEIGCLGAPAIVERLAADPARPALVIVGEPSMMKVVSGHKGIRNFEVIVTGREGHSSAPAKAASAIMAAIPLLSFIADLAAAEAAAADPASLFDPKGPTLTVGVISGGTAPNILARECRFRFDLRATSNAEADRLESLIRARIAQADKAMKARAPEGGVEMLRRSSTPPLTPVLESAAEQFVRALTGDNGQTTASYAAEAGLFQAAGLPTVICGPGDIAQAHQPDEWIALSQLEAGAAFMERLIARLAES
jgi:acetylornithine deacetylase